MLTYETILILNPKIISLEIDQLKEDFKKILREVCDCIRIKIEDIGVKELAYECKGYTNGHYYIFTFLTGNQEINLTSLESMLKKNKSVLKYLTVKKTSSEEAFNKINSIESEQPDALDVLLGFAEYEKKGE